jgi:hypothetical protein
MIRPSDIGYIVSNKRKVPTFLDYKIYSDRKELSLYKGFHKIQRKTIPVNGATLIKPKRESIDEKYASILCKQREHVNRELKTKTNHFEDINSTGLATLYDCNVEHSRSNNSDEVIDYTSNFITSSHPLMTTTPIHQNNSRSEVMQLFSDSERSSDSEKSFILQRNDIFESTEFVPQIFPLNPITAPEYLGLSLKDKRLYVVSAEDDHIFKKWKNNKSYETVIVDKFNIPMTVGKFVALLPGAWLNDEVINFYMCMLNEYESTKQSRKTEYKRNYYFNSFFMERLINTNREYRFDNVRRWTSKLDDLRLYQRLLFPINIDNHHWTLGAVDMVRKEVVYYDSLRGDGARYTEALLHWVRDIFHFYDYATSEDWSYWNVRVSKEGPRQNDGHSCGVFVTMYADYLSDDLPFTFTTSDVHLYFRTKIGTDILRGQLSYL